VWQSFLRPGRCTSATDDDKIFFLRSDTFATLTTNKTVFIKWAAPWCGHSQDLAPAWKQLADTDFADPSARLLIAEVDCAKESKWCEEMGYTAYPTLTYGDASENGTFLQRYQSSNKDYASLKDFVQTTLVNKTFCTPGNYLDLSNGCSNEERDIFRKYFDMDLVDLEAAISKEEDRLKKADMDFVRAKENMQAEYDKASNEHQNVKTKNRRLVKLIRRILEQKAS
jgi:thiol-disulfide isomerase/thioredoxin